MFFLLPYISRSGWLSNVVACNLCVQKGKYNIRGVWENVLGGQQITCIFTCCFYEILRNFTVKKCGRQRQGKILIKKVLGSVVIFNQYT